MNILTSDVFDDDIYLSVERVFVKELHRLFIKEKVGK